MQVVVKIGPENQPEVLKLLLMGAQNLHSSDSAVQHAQGALGGAKIRQTSMARISSKGHGGYLVAQAGTDTSVTS